MDSTMFFKRGGNYMIRSTRRPGLSSPSPRGNKPPKRHIVYKILTILLLVLCWPVGLVLLWLKRPIRWSAAVKLLVSALSLALAFALLSVGLVHDFSNPKLQSAQQKVNLAITAARDAVVNIVPSWRDFVSNAPKIAAVAGDQAIAKLQKAIAPPDAVDRLLDADYDRTLIDRATPTPAPTDTPEPTDTPAPTATPDPSEASSAASGRPTPTAETTPYSDSTATPTPDPNAPTDTPTPEPTATPTPTPEPTATPEPTIDPALIPPLRSAGEITVYFSNNGKWYHATPDCGSVSDLPARTLAEAASMKKPACPYCKPNPPVSTDVLAIENAVYVTSDNYWHTNFGCESVRGEWSVVSLEDARSNPALRPCDACGAIYYAEGLPAANADSVTAAPTVDSISAISNGMTIVYTSERSAYYHASSVCTNAPGVELKPTHLQDALLKDKTACPDCGAPEPALTNAD